ncbi:MAG: hypothetical protein ACR2JY_12030 [Chloroflexota bacterium]
MGMRISADGSKAEPAMLDGAALGAYRQQQLGRVVPGKPPWGRR